jgi:hypothetical protein
VSCALLGALAGGCENDHPVLGISLEPPPGRRVSYQRDIAPLFRDRCAVSGCHESLSLEASLDLSNPFDPVYGAVGVTSLEAPPLLRIEAGNAGGSYLLYKVLGLQEQVGGFGERMPYLSTPLSDDETQLIRDWIDEGASDE